MYFLKNTNPILDNLIADSKSVVNTYSNLAIIKEN